MNENLLMWNHMMMDEAKRLVSFSEERGILIRLMGGAAIALHSQDSHSLLVASGRRLQDLDFVAPAASRRHLTDVMQQAGYDPDKTFNAYNGHTRHLYYSRGPVLNWQVDFFFDQMKMCHTVVYKDRLTHDHPTVPLAELLLQKLQIVKLNAKDAFDIMSLLAEHPLGHDDDEKINLSVLTKILTNDWGYYKTATETLSHVASMLDSDFAHPASELIRGRIEELLDTLEGASKSRKWQLRARIGTRVRWYEEVEEVVR